MVRHLANSDRAWLLFYDGDSVLPELVHGSLMRGQPQDWAMSPVLFIPELALYLGLAAWGLPAKATLILNAIVNFAALYASLRAVAGAAHPSLSRWLRIIGPVIAMGCITTLVLLDTTPDCTSLEVPSLLATATYYSSTVISMILTVGLAVRLCSNRPPRIPWRWLTPLTFLVAISVLTNPLYIAWSVVPLATTVGLVVALDLISWGHARCLLLAVGASTTLGLLLRASFANATMANGLSYAHLDRTDQSFQYYSTLLGLRVTTTLGAVSVTVVLTLIGLNLLLWVRMLKRRNRAGVIVAGLGWSTPVMVVAGAILLGTDAARYLAPVFFAPLLGLCVVPVRLRLEASNHAVTRSITAALAIIGFGVCAIKTVPQLTAASKSGDPSIQCVVQWVTASGRTGAGEFWTVRGPKAYLHDPTQLLQTTNTLAPYPWLVNKFDDTSAYISFVITSSSDPPLHFPGFPPPKQGATTTCGRYTITDYWPSTFTLR